MLSDDSVGSTTELGDEDRSVCLSEWRSCDQVDNGSPSTSPPFWDTDGEDDDPGPSPSKLFGRFTWRIENFSKEKKREMKSEPFEAGGFKWYILVYPQGCDVSNHLSLFLCVANHDKHLPGWSQFAQFTIAVGNLDPKKVKYSDTLHKFWKKEHDWGWKKFMELSKIQDGFLVDDVLEIIAQVQVIREKVDRPFCCLDRPYRRELLRVYMANIEQIYRRFVEEHRSKLTKLTEDKLRWSSFRAFWLAIDPSTRRRMSREKSNVILKIIVKHFFVEKEVTSTLVMDSLHTGLKALEHQCRGKSIDSEKLSAPMVHVDMNMFVLPGDVLALLERAALEPLPCQPLSPKDDKCSQSRTKDGSPGEVKVSIEHEEKRLTVFGQKILETFVLSHIFSGIEVAYQEAVALKRQEELIREEEEAGPLGNEMKGKRGSITEKEKRAKKKQAKQKKNNRKVKDKDREEKFDSTFQEKGKDEITIHDMEDSQAGQVAMKVDTSEEGASDISDNLDGSAEACQAGAKNLHPVDGMNDVGIETENVPTGKNCIVENKSLSCSSGSATMDIMQGKSDNLLDNSSRISPCPRGKTQRRVISSMGIAKDKDDLPSSTASGSDRNTSDCGPAPKLDQETVLLTLKDRLQKLGQHLHEKEIEGRKLLEAHLEKKAAADAALSSSSSSSLEKTPNVLKNPEQPLVTSPDACVCAPPSKSKPVATDSVNGALPAMPNTRISTESGPFVAPTPSKAEPALFKEHVSSLNLKIGRAAPVTSRSLPVDKAATLTSSSSLVKKSIPATSKSPAAQVAPIPAPPKPSAPQAGRVTKATPVPPKSPAPQIEKVAKAIPVLPKSPAPQVDKVVPLNAVPRQLPPVSNLEARKITVQKKIVVTCVPRNPAASRPSSAPLFQAPRSTLPPTPAVQVPPLQSRSFTVSRRATNEPSPPVTSCVPQTYRNAIIGNGSLDTNLSSLDKATSLGQSNALPQPLSAYASTTSVMLPPVGRNGQLPGNQGFMSGHGKLGTLDNWHPWKGDSDGNKHMWRDDTPYQQMTNGDARICPWNDNSYQQATNSGTEEQGRFGGIQHRQFQREIPANFVSHQLQGSVGEEFPHLDIINDLLEEEQSNVSMPEPPLHEYQAFGLPFSPRGNLAEADIASLSSSGRSNLTEHYYEEGYPEAHDRLNALHRLREGQFSTLDAYSNGKVDSISPKPWLYNYPNPMVNPGVNSNGFSQQMGDYTNYASGRMNEEYLYRSANGQW